jgi:hypothetical protein
MSVSGDPATAIVRVCSGGSRLHRNSVPARVYPKYFGPLPQSIQQLWYREAPVNGRTIMSSEFVCQVARSWVEVGSFHTRLLVRLMIFTASVRNIWDTPSYLYHVRF